VDFERRLNAVVAFGQFLAELTQLLSKPGGDALLRVQVIAAVVLAALRDLDAGGEDREQQRIAECLPEMGVYLILEVGKPALVRAGHLAEIERGGIGKDNRRQDDQRALLAGGDVIVVNTYKFCPLRDENATPDLMARPLCRRTTIVTEENTAVRLP
jgi:hypothetical protein